MQPISLSASKAMASIIWRHVRILTTYPGRVAILAVTSEGTKFSEDGHIVRPPSVVNTAKRCSHCAAAGKRVAIDQAMDRAIRDATRQFPNASECQIAAYAESQFRMAETRRQLHEHMEALGRDYVDHLCHSCGGVGQVQYSTTDPPWSGYVVGTHPDNESRIGDRVVVPPQFELQKSWYWNPHKTFRISEMDHRVVLDTEEFEFEWPIDRAAALVVMPEAALRIRIVGDLAQP